MKHWKEVLITWTFWPTWCHDNAEQEALLTWLKHKDTRSLPIKVQRLKILQLKIETFASRTEEDFEIAARFVGLLERVEAVLHGRYVGFYQ